MLPASNRGMGQSLNFPDVCKTPAPPAPFIPVPYPDLGMNMQAAPFSPFVQVGFMPATNMGTLKVMTSGDEAGSMGGLITGIIKGPGKTTIGNPLVFVTGLPAESLANPTSGNMMNAPVGAQIVPSVVNVLYTLRCAARAEPATSGAGDEATRPRLLSTAELDELGEVARGDGDHGASAEVETRWLAHGVACVRLRLFSATTDRDVWNAIGRLGVERIAGVVLDLRGNPGGDGRAALRLAEAFVPRGTSVLVERDVDGDDEPIVARGEPIYPWPTVILVDRASASAAELVAAALQHHRRAHVVGEPTYGKGSGQSAVRYPDGTLRYATVAEYVLPDGSPIDGRGVTPNVSIDSSSTEEGAWMDAALAALGEA